MCSGILAPEQAMPWVDWKWCAEIEPFPCSLIAGRHPNIPNIGDITAVDFVSRAMPVDLLVAGTPCQAFSVAGLRKSLRDHRGNLTLRFVEVVHAIRPRVTVWENVPGVLSTDDNAFGCFLAGLVFLLSIIGTFVGWIVGLWTEWTTHRRFCSCMFCKEWRDKQAAKGIRLEPK